MVQQMRKLKIKSSTDSDGPEPIIDFILVNNVRDAKNDDNRTIFEKNLAATGLQVEFYMEINYMRFVRIFAPTDVLLRYCEIMKLKMPLKSEHSEEGKLFKEHGPYTEQFSRNKQYLFDVESRDFMPSSVRYMIVNFILENEKYDNKPSKSSQSKYGISKLIDIGAYSAAFPLHEEYSRRLLLRRWASVKYFWYKQPVDDVKNYFGNKIALYFVWLDFYTKRMLLPITIIGIIYLITCSIVVDHCFESQNRTYILCPVCDKLCEFEDLSDDDYDGGFGILLGNYISIAYAILMSLACEIFLNAWNRHSAELVYNWGVTDDYVLDYELPSAEGRSRNVPYMILSVTIVMFWIFIVVSIVVALTFYRISLQSSAFLLDLLGSSKSTMIQISGGVLDLISILILNVIYDNIAVWLTDRENCRTHKQYEESLMWKLYIFWFINYYSTFFYIAFFKGNFVGTPAHYYRILGFRQEQCGPDGCTVDLFIQIAVVLIGDTTYNNAIEYLPPYCKTHFARRKHKVNQDLNVKRQQCYENYKLLDSTFTQIAYEHLEMVLQYGTVILFITAFPLAPLVAFLNNIVEIRMDAKKLLLNFRRPVAQNVRSLGLWLTIMDLVTQFSVITNACVLAFTTNLIPYIMYQHYRGSSFVGDSYLDTILSRFNVTEMDKEVDIHLEMKNVTECRYPDFRYPPEHANKYELSEMYWRLLAIRLIFVILFQNLIVFFKILINWLLPSMPSSLKAKIIKEQKRTQKHIIREENLRRKDKK